MAPSRQLSSRSRIASFKSISRISMLTKNVFAGKALTVGGIVAAELDIAASSEVLDRANVKCNAFHVYIQSPRQTGVQLGFRYGFGVRGKGDSLLQCALIC